MIHALVFAATAPFVSLYFFSQYNIVDSEPKQGAGERGAGGYDRQLATCQLTQMRKTEASFSLCVFTLMAPEHICVTCRGGGGLVRVTETDRKLYSEDLDSLAGIFLIIIFFPLLCTAYIKEPCFHPMPALWLCYRR